MHLLLLIVLEAMVEQEPPEVTLNYDTMLYSTREIFHCGICQKARVESVGSLIFKEARGSAPSKGTFFGARFSHIGMYARTSCINIANISQHRQYVS